MLHKLISLKDKRSAKRLGRGISSGKGKTSGRGTKGQKSRSGYNIPRRFEGGQTPLTQRLPKIKGFKTRNLKAIVLDIGLIEKNFKEGDIVSRKTLMAQGLIEECKNPIKILGSKVTKKYQYQDVVLNHKILNFQKKASTLKPSTKSTPSKKS